MTNNNYDYEKNTMDNDRAWDSEHYPGPSHAQLSEDAGLWHFGVVNTPEGVLLVLDIVDNKHDCIQRTRTIAGSLADCYLVSGDPDMLNVLIKHTESLLSKNKCEPGQETEEFLHIVGTYYPMLHCKIIQGSSITASIKTEPAQHSYPGNMAQDARRIWDAVLASTIYSRKTDGASSLQKWSIATKLFLDKCNRRGIVPFTLPQKARTLEALSKKYVQQRNLASMLERQVFSNMASEGLVEDLDRGVWKFLKVAYVDKRYAIVLETRWLSITNKPDLLTKHLVGEEDFTKSEQGGWEHNVSPTCKVLVRMRKYPNISFKMVMSFSKDILLELGVKGRNTDEVLENFEEVAIDWARTRKFRRLKQ